MFVLFYVGHGYHGSLNLYPRGTGWNLTSTYGGEDRDAPAIQQLFSLVQARNKYLLLESCFSQTIIDDIEKWVADFPDLLAAEVATSALRDRNTTGGTFSSLLMAAAPIHSLEEVDFEAWIEQARLLDSVTLNLDDLSGRGGMSFHRESAADSDHDGLPDGLEAVLGTDPQLASSNGSGVCDADVIREDLVDVLRQRNGAFSTLIRQPIYSGAAPYEIVSVLPLPPVVDRNTDLASARIGEEYSHTIQLDRPDIRLHGDLMEVSVVGGAALPDGLALEVTDVAELTLSGTPTETFDDTITVRLKDERGAAAESDLVLHVLPETGKLPGGTIGYTGCGMDNTRDHVLSRGEALMLARGELDYADLQPYVDASNPGEQPFVDGTVGEDHADEVKRDPDFHDACSGAAITISGDGDDADWDHFEVLGDDVSVVVDADHVYLEAGSLVNPDGTGLHITAGSSEIEVHGMLVQGSATGILVEGDHVRFTGYCTVNGNNGPGMVLTGWDAHHVVIEGLRAEENSGAVLDGADHNVVGDPAGRGQGNLFHANPLAGVHVTNGASRNRVCGNTFGEIPEYPASYVPPVPPDRGTQSHGVVIDGGASHNVIGGASPLVARPTLDAVGAGNVMVASSTGYGIWISGDGTDHNELLGNIVGLRPWTDTAAPHEVGIFIDGGASHTRVGKWSEVRPTSVSPLGNLVVHNVKYGIQVDGASSEDNVLLANRVSHNGDGTTSSQQICTGGAHGGLTAPTLALDASGDVRPDAQESSLVQIYAWPPDTADAFSYPVLLFAGYPGSEFALDLDTLPPSIGALLPAEGTAFSVTADQTPHSVGTSALANPVTVE